MIRNTLLVLMILFGLFLQSQNFVATYSFSAVTSTTGIVDPTPPPVVAGLTMGSFTAIGVSDNPTAAGRFSFTGWPLGSSDGMDHYPDFTGELSAKKYFEITLSVISGYTLNLKSIAFNVRRSSTGIRTYCVRSSLDNFGTNLAAGTGTNSKLGALADDTFLWRYDSLPTSGDQRGSVILPGKDFQLFTGGLTLRFYGWNAEANGGSFSVDNVTFSGMAFNKAEEPDLTSLSEDPYDQDPVIYPNPVTGEELFLKANNDGCSFLIFDLHGKVVPLPFAAFDGRVWRADVSQMPSGLYFIRESGGSGRLQKLLIRR